jgi:hypothetical protein
MLRYSVLRTNFFYEKVEKPRQIVLKERKADLKVIDYSDLDEKTFNTEYNKLLDDEVNRNFDLRKDALLRATYVKLNNSSKLIFTMHHIIMDGWCNTIIYSDFFDFYHKLECGEDYKKLELQIFEENARKSSYSDYIKWLNKQDKKRISLPTAQIKVEIYIKLNEGTILNFIRNSIKKETPDLNSNENSSEMKYDLNMINKYEEESNSNLSFISEFDLEEENKNNESFDSCFDENSVEEIDIVNK